ncbi:MAG: response regulator [Cetobacterium sp.]|uniref:Response regulator receiver and ANTAR domain protein n=1 Tax=Cetobacterium ceti TaxID=180163 RepID=A0A1T4MBG1_9FUSO|nr:response regulator [Cetobacterium ceti]MCJ8342798.1 response regulator [Cetobacterium sp.]SJZ64245.1 response regulator receiver and ANTAR domain protein [Cetobacterium ceti]
MKIKVVIAEDETLTRMDLIEILEDNDYEVVGEASDGLEAIDIINEKKPDLVLLDVKMPLMTGLQVAKVLKENRFDGCVVMLTAYNIKDYINKATENSASGYLLKPIDEGIFLSHLKLIYSKFLELKNLKDEMCKTKKKLEERKILEKAKGILMAKHKWDEGKAYEFMRNLSMEKRITMGKLSEIIVTVGGVS